MINFDAIDLLPTKHCQMEFLTVNLKHIITDHFTSEYALAGEAYIYQAHWLPPLFWHHHHVW